MDQSVTNELLNRIKTLQKKNQEIRQQINMKKEEIASLNFTANSHSLSLEHVEKEIEKTIRKNEMAYYDLRSNEDIIKMNVIEYIIEYDPNDNLGVLYISGDFTNWELKSMNKSKGIYSFSVILLKHFKYYYCMLDSQGQITIDTIHPHENNPRTNQICNYIDLGSKGKQSPQFDHSLQGNILSLQKRNLLMINSRNWEEVAYLESLLIYSNNYQQQLDIILKESEMIEKAIDDYIGMKEFQSFSFGETKLTQLLSAFKGCVVIKDNIEFEIIEVDKSQYVFVCLRLYDSNHIQLNKEYYIQNELFTLITFNDILSSSDRLLSFKDSDAFMNQYSNNSNTILKVYYSRDHLLSVSPNEQYAPNKIEPSILDMNDYIYEIADGQIIEVKNKKDNLLMRFIALELKKAAKLKQIEIYYSLNYKNVNIIHVHYLDSSLLSIPIEGIVIDNKFDIKAFKDKTKQQDINRLFILCKSMKTFKLYYKGKKVHFTSQSFVHERLYQIRSCSIDNSFNQYYIKIKHIPIGYLIKCNPNDKIQGSQSPLSKFSSIESCSKSQSTKGYIDATVLFDESKTVLSDELNFSFPPCTLIALDPQHEIELDKQYIDYKKKHSSYEMKKYELIQKELKTYNKYNEKELLLSDLPKETIKKMLFTLKDYQSSAQIIASYIEQKELWEKIEDVTNMQTEISEYIKLLSKYQ